MISKTVELTATDIETLHEFFVGDGVVALASVSLYNPNTENVDVAIMLGAETPSVALQTSLLAPEATSTYITASPSPIPPGWRLWAGPTSAEQPVNIVVIYYESE